MFARRRELLEREAERIGALAVAGDVTIPQRPRAARRRRPSTRSAASTSSCYNGGGPPRAPRPRSTAEQVEEAVAAAPRLRSCASSGSASRTSSESGRGRIVNDRRRRSVREPIDNLALSNAVRPGVVGWAEDARARARPERDHRQLDRARADRHRPHPRGLPGRARPRTTSSRSRSAARHARARSATSSRSSPPTAPRT